MTIVLLIIIAVLLIAYYRACNPPD